MKQAYFLNLVTAMATLKLTNSKVQQSFTTNVLN